jgi:hypothetical protein
MSKTKAIPASTAAKAFDVTRAALTASSLSTDNTRICSVRARLSPGQPFVPGSAVFSLAGTRILNQRFCFSTLVLNGTATTTGMRELRMVFDTISQGRLLNCSLPLVSDFRTSAQKMSPRCGEGIEFIYQPDRVASRSTVDSKASWASSSSQAISSSRSSGTGRSLIADRMAA